MRTKTGLISLALLSAIAGGALAMQPANPVTKPAATEHNARQEVLPVAMIDKRVLGRYNEYLGTIVAVDEKKQTADMKTTTGTTLALPLDMLVVSGDHVAAPTLSRGDILAMTRKNGAPDLREVKGSVAQ